MTQRTNKIRDIREPDPGFAGCLTGEIASVGDDGRVCVVFPGSHGVAVRARVAVAAAEQRTPLVGTPVALVFEDEDPKRPIIVGMVRDSFAASEESVRVDAEAKREVTLDEKRLVFEADEEVVLKCGKASLTLRKDGTVVVRGANVVSRSTGANRIKGASITLN